MKRHFRIIATLLFTLTFVFCTNTYVSAQNVSEERKQPQVMFQGVIRPISGTETLYRGSGSIGTFTLVGSNLTPVKTMGDSGSFTLYGTATANTDYFCIRVQIRDYYTGQILCSTTTGNVINSNGSWAALYSTPTISVYQGQKIQIYMDYITAPSTSAVISMSYSLT